MKISQAVFELQSGNDFVTDRRMDRRTGQKQYVSQPYGGRHKNTEARAQIRIADGQTDGHSNGSECIT